MRASCLALSILVVSTLLFARAGWTRPLTSKRESSGARTDQIKEPPAAAIQFNGRQEKLYHSDSGPGVIVCDPILKNCQDDLADISRGCAAWLQLVVAGQPQCSRTPFWKSLRRVQTELGRRDLRLEKKDAARLALYTGANVVLVGTVEGNSGSCSLTYQPFKAPSMQPLGDPVKISGSKVELANQMPKMAALLCNDIEISPEHLPDMPPGLSELALAGRVQSRTTDAVSKSARAELLKLSSSSALAGLLYLDTAMPADPALGETAANLVRQEAANSLVFGQIGWMQGKLLQFCSKRLSENIKNYPTNYLFKTAGVYLERASNDSKGDLAAAKQCVQSAPDNPDAWLTLAQSYNFAADRLRKGRFYTDLNSAEKRQFDEAYPLWLGCAEQAVKIDPLFGRAWLRTSTAAAYSGFLEESDRAFEKALELDRDRYDVYAWGVQLYQPKWFNKIDKLRHLAEIASKDPTLNERNKQDLARALQTYPDLARLFIKLVPKPGAAG